MDNLSQNPAGRKSDIVGALLCGLPPSEYQGVILVADLNTASSSATPPAHSCAILSRRRGDCYAVEATTHMSDKTQHVFSGQGGQGLDVRLGFWFSARSVP